MRASDSANNTGKKTERAYSHRKTANDLHIQTQGVREKSAMAHCRMEFNVFIGTKADSLKPANMNVSIWQTLTRAQRAQQTNGNTAWRCRVMVNARYGRLLLSLPLPPPPP